jgi:hypothetical protein
VSVKPASSSIDAEIGVRGVARIGSNVTGIFYVRLASATAATRGRTLFRSAATAAFIALAFDPDDGKDQDGPHSLAGSAIHG